MAPGTNPLKKNRVYVVTLFGKLPQFKGVKYNFQIKKQSSLQKLYEKIGTVTLSMIIGGWREVCKKFVKNSLKLCKNFDRNMSEVCKN